MPHKILLKMSIANGMTQVLNSEQVLGLECMNFFFIFKDSSAEFAQVLILLVLIFRELYQKDKLCLPYEVKRLPHYVYL